MAYNINRYNGQVLVVLEDGTVNTSTSIGLVGRNYTGYGEIQNENFLFLLENFSGISAPTRPVSGQTWFDTVNNKLNVYDGTQWISVGSATVSNSSPNPANGAFWLKNDTDQLFVYDGTNWREIGPEALPGFGVTRAVSVILSDTGSPIVDHAVIVVTVNDSVVSMIANEDFTINPTLHNYDGFLNLKAGINLPITKTFNGNLTGNATTASRLETFRTINGVAFDGSQNITISSNTSNKLIKGNYLTGEDFDGSSTVTMSVDATSSAVPGTIIARDTGGDFSAGTITANLVGDVTGNVNAASGTSRFDVVEATQFIGASLSGNAATATRLSPGKKVNSVLFDGTSDITIAAAAGTLTGETLNPSVIFSSLTSVGTLGSLAVNGSATISGPTQVTGTATFNGAVIIGDALSDRLTINSYVSSDIKPDSDLTRQLGANNLRWTTVYAQTFDGTATTARYADLAENYVADAEYGPGTVVEFGGTHEITKCTHESCTRVAGIVSTDPAHLMNSACVGEFVVAIALQGRVPCKVTGPIKKGDMLVSAGNGRAKASENPSIGAVLGKALEDSTGGDTVIEVVAGIR